MPRSAPRKDAVPSLHHCEALEHVLFWFCFLVESNRDPTHVHWGGGSPWGNCTESHTRNPKDTEVPRPRGQLSRELSGCQP